MKNLSNKELKKEKMALIGESGTGKTFLLQSLRASLDNETTLIIDIKPSSFTATMPEMFQQRFQSSFGYKFIPFERANFVDIHDCNIDIDIAKYETIVVDEGWHLSLNQKLLKKVQEFANIPLKTLIIAVMDNRYLKECGMTIGNKPIASLCINEKSNRPISLYNIEVHL